MIAARIARPFAALLPGSSGATSPSFFDRIRAMLALAPGHLPASGPAGGTIFPAEGKKRGRVALLQGCAQQVLSPGINQAAIRMLTATASRWCWWRDEQCCGSLTHHMGHDADALRRARANIEVWDRRGRQEWPRRHPRDHVGMRHDDQGLRLHAARRTVLMQQKPHEYRLSRRT